MGVAHAHCPPERQDCGLDPSVPRKLSSPGLPDIWCMQYLPKKKPPQLIILNLESKTVPGKEDNEIQAGREEKLEHTSPQRRQDWAKEWQQRRFPPDSWRPHFFHHPLKPQAGTMISKDLFPPSLTHNQKRNQWKLLFFRGSFNVEHIETVAKSHNRVMLQLQKDCESLLRREIKTIWELSLDKAQTGSGLFQTSFFLIRQIWGWESQVTHSCQVHAPVSLLHKSLPHPGALGLPVHGNGNIHKDVYSRCEMEFPSNMLLGLTLKEGQ